MDRLCLWTKIRTKFVLGESAFQCMHACPNATIVLVYISAKIKMSFIWKDVFFFFAKIGIFCKSIASPLSEAYTQPYKFGGRIKLIICQIRHEVSVTIHEISFSWKNHVRLRTQFIAASKIVEKSSSITIAAIIGRNQNYYVSERVSNSFGKSLI